jgi:hypothetical protein
MNNCLVCSPLHCAGAKIKGVGKPCSRSVSREQFSDEFSGRGASWVKPLLFRMRSSDPMAGLSEMHGLAPFDATNSTAARTTRGCVRTNISGPAGDRTIGLMTTRERRGYRLPAVSVENVEHERPEDAVVIRYPSDAHGRNMAILQSLLRNVICKVSHPA